VMTSKTRLDPPRTLPMPAICGARPTPARQDSLARKQYDRGTGCGKLHVWDCAGAPGGRRPYG